GSILDYYAQIHRDWGWESEGCREALDAAEAVGSILADHELGRFLVLGAGACRLTQELHHRYRATATLALDVDPLPFVVAQRLLQGRTVRLYEFPAWPLDSTKLFADRSLSSATPADPTLRLVFADARDPPVRAQSFDTVLTPWFIDLVDMPALFERIWQVLVPGGCWINFGPLLYGESATGLPGRYCIDEVFDRVETAGFSIERHSFRRMTYMHSPISCQGRVETVLTFCARRLADKPAQPDAQSPDWLVDAALPVPVLPGLERYEPTHAMLRTIVNLIDGKRSASDIGDLLVRHHSLPREHALTAVTACLRAIERDARTATTTRPG
ncbi:MAG TPA: class I SAM-dependent methyltransferase, partial [Polyangiaceae bacterium]|nr:class I SAM-dependent methyltransferase [Polyangiaceae bacterium]